jgi:hypothetical protein
LSSISRFWIAGLAAEMAPVMFENWPVTSTLVWLTPMPPPMKGLRAEPGRMS